MTVRIPGLRGNDPLGFLAAVGLVALAEQDEIPALTLAWDVRWGHCAVADGQYRSLDDMGAHLKAAFERIRDSGRVLPGVDAAFPLRKEGRGSDPMRMPRPQMARFHEKAEERWLAQDDPWLARWLVALAAQCAVKDVKRGDVELTPFYAPSGQMSLRTSIFEKTMEAVDAVDGPVDALTMWRRTGYDGANFDERAKRDAGVTTSGKPANQGAPSPTWLAAMGMRFFPLVDDGRSTATVGWQRLALYPGYTSRSLVWPLWEPQLDAVAVRTLLAHPALTLQESENGGWQPSDRDALEGLGVVRVFGASRRTLSQGDGPLGAAVQVWSGLASAVESGAEASP